MPAKILSGREARDSRLPTLIEGFKKLSSVPELVIIQVGDRPDSAAYIKAKVSFAERIGVKARHVHLPLSISQESLVGEIEKHNHDSSVKGIIVQLPLPEGLDRRSIVDAIDPHKDIDGLTSANAKLLVSGARGGIIPATARGVVELLDFYHIGLQGKRAAIVGRSELVGKPVARLFANNGAQVTVVHKGTADVAKETRSADIIVVAAGSPRLIKAGYVSQGQIVIDIGINRSDEIDSEGLAPKLVGDVDFEAVFRILGENGAITPVPGGVGPMTVLALFENLLDACLLCATL